VWMLKAARTTVDEDVPLEGRYFGVHARRASRPGTLKWQDRARVESSRGASLPRVTWIRILMRGPE
jgi:hypothetical protein